MLGTVAPVNIVQVLVLRGPMSQRRRTGLVSTLDSASQRTSTIKVTAERVSVRSRQKFHRFCGRLVPQTVKVLLALGTFHLFHRWFLLRMHVTTGNGQYRSPEQAQNMAGIGLLFRPRIL